MLAAIIVIVELLILAIAEIGKLCMELDELNRRTQDIADVMHEADELSNKEDEQ